MTLLDDEYKYEVTQNMQRHGGSFVQILGVLIQRADIVNLTRIMSVFQEYIDEYAPEKWEKNEQETTAVSAPLGGGLIVSGGSGSSYAYGPTKITYNSIQNTYKKPKKAAPSYTSTFSAIKSSNPAPKKLTMRKGKK